MKKLHILMLSAAFLFSGCKVKAQTSLSEIIMPFPTFALGAGALYMLSGTLDILDKTTELGEILDQKTATDNKTREKYGLKPRSFLHKWSLITECLSKTALGVAMLPLTAYVFLGKLSAAIAKNEF